MLALSQLLKSWAKVLPSEELHSDSPVTLYCSHYELKQLWLEQLKPHLNSLCRTQVCSPKARIAASKSGVIHAYVKRCFIHKRWCLASAGVRSNSNFPLSNDEDEIH